MIKKVPCQFCQQPAPYSPIEELETIAVSAYWCDNCQAELLYFKDSDHVNSWSLYVAFNNRVYRWTVGASGNAALIYVKNAELPRTRVSQDVEKLLLIPRGSTQPVITPQNIEQKVKTYLLFL
jgi:hypothetical protein